MRIWEWVDYSEFILGIIHLVRTQKISEKLSCLIFLYAHQGVRSNSFSENFYKHTLNEWFHLKDKLSWTVQKSSPFMRKWVIFFKKKTLRGSLKGQLYERNWFTFGSHSYFKILSQIWQYFFSYIIRKCTRSINKLKTNQK